MTPRTLVVDLAILTVIGAVMVASMVLIVPGVACLAYASVLGFEYAAREGWASLERFTDWWNEGR
jgi:UPF0716 family protein affecting phage T7 exclusion